MVCLPEFDHKASIMRRLRPTGRGAMAPWGGGGHSVGLSVLLSPAERDAILRYAVTILSSLWRAVKRQKCILYYKRIMVLLDIPSNCKISSTQLKLRRKIKEHQDMSKKE